MKVLHTSDWHLGHMLGELSRAPEHARFLGWLLDRLASEAVDALLIAGDVFDGSNPTPATQAMYYGFLAECRRRLPNLDVVVVGGNHDSPGRLDAPADLLKAMRVRVVGGLPSLTAETLADRVLVPLHRADGEIGAWVLAVPFLRPSDIPAGSSAEPLKLAEAVQQIYCRLSELAAACRLPGQALIGTGHCYMVGGEISELSERKIQRGNQDALPVSIFPPEMAYVALGHLHKAQMVGGCKHIRYSGAPLPLSLNERRYQHQVGLVEFEGDRFVRYQPLPVPRFADLLAVPETHAPLEEVLEQLKTLPTSAPEATPEAIPPFLEVRVQVEKFQPNLKTVIQEAVQNCWVQLVRIDTLTLRPNQPLAETVPRQNLRDMNPVEVFRKRFHSKYPDAEMPAALQDAFHELLETVQQAER
ncbi:MAG: exonuclease SbcCD subunit D C-terminal domain-containing protein [Blastocatellia bacterium]|nr:exonuclease SbcCD subunit D C-terminal domain-containing protein [Blastocatellia bacterium]